MAVSPNSTEKSPYEDIQPFQGVILGIIATPGVIGNIFALVVTAKLLKVQKQSPNVFIIGLACCDLIGILTVCIPTWICYAFEGWQGGDLLCNFQGFATLLFSMGSGLMATSMSIDRFLSIKAPFFHRSHVKVSTATKLVFVIMVFSSIFAVMPVLGFGSFVLNLTGTYCTINWFASEVKDKAFSCIYATVGILMVLVVVLCNIAVILLLLKKRKIRQKLSATFHNKIREKKSSSDRLQQQFSRMMMIISLLFLICWIPFMFRIVGNISGIWISSSADLNASRLLLLNLVLDPFIYVLTRKHYREALKQMLCCHCWKRKLQRYLSVKKLSSSGTGMTGSKLSIPSLHNIDKIGENGCVVEVAADVNPNCKLLTAKTPIKYDEARNREVNRFIKGNSKALCETHLRDSDDACCCETTGLADTNEVCEENSCNTFAQSDSQFIHVTDGIEDKLAELYKDCIPRRNTTPRRHGAQYTGRKELCKSFPSTTAVEKSPL